MKRIGWKLYESKRINLGETMQEVISSNISHVGYDEETKTLKVRFKAGGEYHYFDVPSDAHQQLLSAKSIGAHFAKNVRNVYQFKKAEVQ
jgi:hypothetical protein